MTLQGVFAFPLSLLFPGSQTEGTVAMRALCESAVWLLQKIPPAAGRSVSGASFGGVTLLRIENAG